MGTAGRQLFSPAWQITLEDYSPRRPGTRCSWAYVHVISHNQSFWWIHLGSQELWPKLCPELEFFSLEHGVFWPDDATFELSLGERPCLPLVHGFSSHTGAAFTAGSRKDWGGSRAFLSKCIPLASPLCTNTRLFATTLVSQRNKSRLRTGFPLHLHHHH